MKPYDSIQDHFQRPTILLIDDNPANLGIITEYLEAHSIRVLVARNGKSGVKKAQYAAPALILLDVLMPETDGFTICQQLKADEDTRDIPVIFMTALTDPKDKVRGFEVGGSIMSPNQFSPKRSLPALGPICTFII